MSLLTFLLHVLFWGVIAMVLHELAHALAAVLLGRRLAGIDWYTLDVYWEPAAPPDWRDYLIGWTPLLTGLLAAAAVVLTAVSLSPPLWLALGFYALHGGRDDLSVSVVDSGPVTRQH